MVHATRGADIILPGQAFRRRIPHSPSTQQVIMVLREKLSRVTIIYLMLSENSRASFESQDQDLMQLLISNLQVDARPNFIWNLEIDRRKTSGIFSGQSESSRLS